MPYIKQEQRKLIDVEINNLLAAVEKIPNFKASRGGILNYIITRLGLGLLDKKSYKELSLIKSAMTDAADEWYRRQMAPYEDKKIEENGDVKNSFLPLKFEGGEFLKKSGIVVLKD